VRVCKDGDGEKIRREKLGPDEREGKKEKKKKNFSFFFSHFCLHASPSGRLERKRE
jgi:hypothetical protein